ncbi:MAG: metallophosphoesterase [Acidobacteriales bacterium]|nr:metallophosphoesterase [Terriglobales bacterium]
MFQFIHAADIHLDSPLRGLSSFGDAPVDHIRTATRRAFEYLVDLTLREAVAFVLIAGDLWDGDWPDAGPGLFFIKQARRLREAGIPVCVVKGNHYAENTLKRELRYPKNGHLFGHVRPETVRLDAHHVAIHGHAVDLGEVWLERILVGTLPLQNASAFPLSEEIRDLMTEISADEALICRRSSESGILRTQQVRTFLTRIGRNRDRAGAWQAVA